jgi:hypothetical protein
MKATLSSGLAILILVAATSIPTGTEARTAQEHHALRQVRAGADGAGAWVTAPGASVTAPGALVTTPSKRTLAPPAPSRINEFYGWWHDAGELLLHTSNLGFIGDWGSAEGEPSAEWPGASGYEHLYCAGLWVGARVGPDTLVTAGVYGREFRPPPDDPVYTIYVSSAGSPGGAPGVDDDSDGLVDEEWLDGIDNDLDGAIDEDYAALSDEMFACTYFDTMELDSAPPQDIHTPMGLAVHETSFAWSHDRFDDFVIIRYEVENIGGDLLEDVYLGIMVDPDVGLGGSTYYLDDRVAYLNMDMAEAPTQKLARLQMGHCWDEPGGADGDWAGHIGFAVLDHPTDPDGIDAPATVGPLAYRSWYAGSEDPINDAERYRYMSQPHVSPPAAVAQDWRFLLSVGPFDQLAPGETTFFEIAVVCGHGVRGLIDNAAAIFCGLEHAAALRHLEGPPDRSGIEPPTLSLAPATPNPSAGSTRIAFALPEAAYVRLSVLSPGGRRVATLVDGECGPGEHAAAWDGRTDSGSRASSGVYVVRLEALGREVFRKLVRVR